MSPRWTSRAPSLNSPRAKHIGELPSQQPPDWWNISGPCWVTSRAIQPSASSVAAIVLIGSEEAHRLRIVGDQEVLGVLVVGQHHLVVLAADAGLLVAPERGVRRVQVVAVGPHAAGLERAAGAVD